MHLEVEVDHQIMNGICRGIIKQEFIWRSGIIRRITFKNLGVSQQVMQNLWYNTDIVNCFYN